MDSEDIDSSDIPTRPDVGQAGEDWTDYEVSLTVDDYFEMLAAEVAGRPYKKSDHNRRLRQQLHTRTKGAIEYKHGNISAILDGWGLRCIDGYKPYPNAQQIVATKIADYLRQNQQLLHTLAEASDEATPLKQVGPVTNAAGCFVPPPQPRDLPTDVPSPRLSRAVAKRTLVEWEARNRELGDRGEQFTIELERRRLVERGRDDLASRVEWVASTVGDGLGYDVVSFDPVDDSELCIEVKTTNRGMYFPFYLTANELRCSEENSGAYRLYRVFQFAKNPTVFVLSGALTSQVRLQAMTYRAAI